MASDVFKIRTRVHVYVGVACIVAVSLGAMLLHVQINYDAEMRDLVRWKAATSTVVVAIPMAYFVLLQMLKNQELTEELRRLVNRDHLTNLASRDFFFSRMQERPDAYGVSLMIDIDHFKRINDAYGHLAGDAVITRVAKALYDNSREQDIVCRFGGEEFVIFLHEQGASSGFEIAERMRKAVANEALEYDGQAVSVTVSIGGSLKERLQDINVVIQQADAALYRAKSEGRNKTVFSDDPA